MQTLPSFDTGQSWTRRSSLVLSLSKDGLSARLWAPQPTRRVEPQRPRPRSYRGCNRCPYRL